MGKTKWRAARRSAKLTGTTEDATASGDSSDDGEKAKLKGTDVVEGPADASSKDAVVVLPGTDCYAEATPAKTSRGAYVQRVTLALQQRRFKQALSELRQMRQRGHVPLLGTLQRWVREVDDCLIKKNDEGTRVLHALIVIASKNTLPDGEHPSLDVPVKLNIQPVFEIPATPVAAPQKAPQQDFKSLSKIALHQAGPDRQPPNRHDLDIFAPSDACFPGPDGPSESVAHAVPGVDGTVVIDKVFTAEEVQSFMAYGEAMGFQADEPLGREKKSQDVLGRACVWMAPEELLKRMWDRIKPHVPESYTVGSGVRGVAASEVKVRGLNPRFRSYRYDTGFVYRPHIDGGWPCSGYAADGTYKYDVDEAQTSRLTLVVYLNDEFEGGSTTFYLNGDDGNKGAAVDVRAVHPRAGACILFPHGDSQAPVHEGSQVVKGAKYIIRTEVLYTRPEARGRHGSRPEDLKQEAKPEDPKAKKKGKTRDTTRSDEFHGKKRRGPDTTRADGFHGKKLRPR